MTDKININDEPLEATRALIALAHGAVEKAKGRICGKCPGDDQKARQLEIVQTKLQEAFAFATLDLKGVIEDVYVALIGDEHPEASTEPAEPPKPLLN